MGKKPFAGFILAAGLSLLVVSCQPFMLSLFPGYLADAVAVRDVSGLISGANAEHYDFCVLKGTTAEYAFIVVSYYDGRRELIVFDSGLAYVGTFSGFDFGSRHFVDYNGNFVIGGCYLPAALTAASLPLPITNNPWGTDGFGCVIRQTSVTLVNAFFESNGQLLNVQYFGTAWGTAPAPDTVQLNSGMIGDFKLVFSDRLQNITLGTNTNNLSILAFRDGSSRPEKGFAVFLLEGPPAPGYSGIKLSEPLLTTMLPYHVVMPVGGLMDDANPIFAVNDGLVVRGADKTMRLIGWDGRVKAATRDNGASGDVLLGFSPTDFYYVFDPASLKLIKALDWW